MRSTLLVSLLLAGLAAGCFGAPRSVAPDVQADGAQVEVHGAETWLTWQGHLQPTEGKPNVDARWEVPISTAVYATMPIHLPDTATTMHADFSWSGGGAPSLGFLIENATGHIWCGALPSPLPTTCTQTLHAARSPVEEWQILLVGDLSQAPSSAVEYRFVARVSGEPVAVLGPPQANGTLAFTPTVHVDDRLQGVEPSIAVTPAGQVWIAALTGQPGGLWHSRDGGASFDRVAVDTLPYCDDSRFRVPPARASHVGCGDTDVATSGEHTVYFSDHWGGEGVHSSHDGGSTWMTQLFGTGADVHTDRQWLATDGDQTAWMSYDGQLGVATGRPSVSRTIDGGRTWLNVGSVPVQAQCVTGFARDVEGRLFVADCDANGLGVGVSTDGGLTFAWHPVGTSPPNSIIPAVTTDAAGTVYVVWTEPMAGGGSHILFASSGDHGTTWSSPAQVALGPGTYVYAWATAGAPGHLAIASYGTREVGTPDVILHDWYPMLAVTADATAGHGNWTVGAVSDQPAQVGPICLGGNGCANGRNLGDFFQIQADPQGRVHVAWVDGTGGGDSSTGRLRYAHTLDGVLGSGSVDKNGGK